MQNKLLGNPEMTNIIRLANRAIRARFTLGRKTNENMRIKKATSFILWSREWMGESISA
ncbi:hypothetical protein [Methanohalophilus profundi]|uniref:hypothetical protein n=1 Tax=Methanohalophilus profundi TaxID=2138083 RepID=UPI002989EC8D|nr:hypothetical protein [Methanohalophilus profundi]